MDGNELLLLGLGIQSPWKLVDQRLDVDRQPHELHLTVGSERGTRFACPVCGTSCAAHDFQEKTWRHLNFFQHHCYINASVPQVKYPEHGVKLVEVPWARKGSAFTLLFEQVALTLAREMPVSAAARIIEITDRRLWRIVEYYVAKAVAAFDLSGAFLSAVPKQLPTAQITVDWFHIVQTFTRALDDVRKAENRIKPLPKHLRWAVLKRGEVDRLTTNQLKALVELLAQGLDTATAWRIKERLRWVRLARTRQAARWRITRFINYAKELIGESRLLWPMNQALNTLATHAERVVRRWTSTYTNARLEGLNGLFQAARARARGYRNVETFMTMIYMIGSPAGAVLNST